MVDEKVFFRIKPKGFHEINRHGNGEVSERKRRENLHDYWNASLYGS